MQIANCQHKDNKAKDNNIFNFTKNLKMGGFVPSAFSMVKIYHAQVNQRYPMVLMFLPQKLKCIDHWDETIYFCSQKSLNELLIIVLNRLKHFV